MAVAQQDTTQTPGEQVSSLAALDRSLSTALFRNLGAQIPRPALMLFEHAGNGLFWIPGALAVWLLPGLMPYQRTLVANLLAGFVVDIIVVGTIKGTVRRGASFIALFAAVCWHAASRPLAAAVLAWGAATAVSRALLGRHFLGDVAAGCLVGAATTAVITRGSWDIGTPLLPEALSQQWYHAAAAWLSGLPFAPLQQLYGHQL